MYYLLGGLAILVGLVVLLWFPDSPITWRILTEEQRIVCLERVRDDQGGIAKKKFKKDQVIEASLDVRMWLIVLAMLVRSTTLPSNRITKLINAADTPSGELTNCWYSLWFGRLCQFDLLISS